MCGFQTTEDGREGEACPGTAEEENGERGTENDEEGAKDGSKAFLTFLGSTGHLNKIDPLPVFHHFYSQFNMPSLPPISSAICFGMHWLFLNFTDFLCFPFYCIESNVPFNEIRCSWDNSIHTEEPGALVGLYL